MFKPLTVADYRSVFNALPGVSALVLPDTPDYTVIAATDEFVGFAGTIRKNLVGHSIFTYFPDNPNAANGSNDVRASFLKCIATRQKSELAVQRYDIVDAEGNFVEMYWQIIQAPVLDDSGEVQFIVHSAVNVTDRIHSVSKDETIRSLQIAHNLFMQSTIAIHIFKGADLVVELANEPTLAMWGKDASVIGKPLHEAIPELSQHYLDLLNSVRVTKVPYQGHEEPVLLNRDGKDEIRYVNFVLQPYYEGDKNNAVGVIAMVTDVTDSYNDRKVLAEKERSLALAVEIGDLGTFSIDLRNNTVSYSPQIMKWFGVTRLNLPLSELLRKVHPDDQPAVGGTLSKISQGQQPRRHDVTFRLPHPETGELQYLRSIGQIQTEDDEPVTVSGIIQDISKIMETRSALEQSAQRLKSFIDSTPFPMGVYTGKEMKIEMANQAILNAWGRDKSVIGLNYAEVLTELEGKGIFEQLDQVYTTGNAFHAHNTRVDLIVDGVLQPFYFNYSFTPLFDAAGNVYGVMNTAADVTDLALVQKALRESERNFRMMILKAPVAMALLNGPRHVVEVANESIIDIWGKTSEEVINKPVFEALPEAKEQGLEHLLSHVYRTGETISANEHMLTLVRFGKTEVIYVNFTYEPYRDGNGDVVGVLVIAIDVTEQVIARFKIEEMVAERTKELELSNSSLQKSNAELEQFAYIASHDLQEPLRKINMFTGMLQRSLGELSDSAQGHMNSINNSVNRMTNLIRDILSYSQLSQKHESFESTNLVDIFNEAVSDFDMITDEKHAEITHSGLPVIDAIPLQMTQLFHNLISNALKYSRPEVRPIITITGTRLTANEAIRHGLITQMAEPYYSISFRDNGIGFSQEYAEKIFNIFQRLHVKGKYEGTGIGLAMCKKIAENHRGIVYAKSKEGEGTVFTVILPSVQNL